MFNLLQATVSPLALNMAVLEVAYQLYLEAPEDNCPRIDLKALSKRTGRSLLECRNAIVEANKLGRFPNCTLQS